MSVSSQISAPAVINIDKGLPQRVQPVHEHKAITVMPVKRLMSLVPDSRHAEDVNALRYLSESEQDQARLRNEVQRLIKNTAKGKNAHRYASYIAKGQVGDWGNRWDTPPFTLWLPASLEIQEYAGPLGTEYLAYLPEGVKGVLVDAETQLIAHYILLATPSDFGVTKQQVLDRQVPVEIIHGVTLDDARQIFHDRNLLGIVPNKTTALNTDTRDAATAVASDIMDAVQVTDPITGEVGTLRDYISVNKRQLGRADKQWMTLSTLRNFVVTAIFGRAGFDLTSRPVALDSLPEGCKESDLDEVVEIATALFEEYSEEFSDRANTVITAPAVVAALGAVAHRSMSWSPAPHRTVDDFIALLDLVNWKRDARVWDGVCAKITPSGSLSFAGGVKDSGSKTATAIEDDTAASYKQVRTQHDDLN